MTLIKVGKIEADPIACRECDDRFDGTVTEAIWAGWSPVWLRHVIDTIERDGAEMFTGQLHPFEGWDCPVHREMHP